MKKRLGSYLLGAGFLVIVGAAATACGTKNELDPVRAPTPPTGAPDAPELKGPDVSGPPAGKALSVQPPSQPVVKETPSPWRVDGQATPVAEVVIRAIDAAHDIALDGVAETVSSKALRAELAGEPDVVFERALVAYVDAARATPRPTDVLVNDDGTYHSPDALWLDRRVELGAPPSEVATKAVALARAGDAAGLEAYLAALAPDHPQYQALIAAAGRYASLCADSPWPEIVWDKRQRVKGPMETLVRDRLAVEGFILADEPLADSIKRYRYARQMPTLRRYIDEDLIKDLNIPCDRRLETIRLNMKRWRHTAMQPDDTARVFVNLAAQELIFTVGAEQQVVSRVVVGSSRSYFTRDTKRRIFRNATPILKDTIETVVVNPEWNVPQRIGRQEIEPAIEKDPEYLTKNKFRVIETRSGGKIYVQTAGAHNALGRLKILFPNDEGIYLHDTPSKAKFQLPVRAASHGCVRVEKVQELGIAILNHDRELNPDSRRRLFDIWLMKSYIGTARTHAFRLTSNIPVYLEYYTASVAPVEGLEVVRFHPDVYHYDGDSRDAIAAAAAEETASPEVAAP